MRRFIPALGVSLVAAAALAANVGASKPIFTPVPSFPIDLPTGTACPFEVMGDVVANNQTTKTFSDGTMKSTGSFKAKLSANGLTLTLNVPGSVTLIPNGDGFTFVGTGANIFAFFPGDLGPSHPGGALWLLSGHTTYQLDENFFPVPGTFFHEGSTTDLCAALTP